MKKLFLTLAVALTALCASAKGNKIPVYAWAGFADNATEKSLKGKLSDFFYNFTAHKLIQPYISVSHLDISCHHLYKIKML